ncbi:MAG: hypothetical protein AAF799_01085 [Myxococcota bacterium]
MNESPADPPKAALVWRAGMFFGFTFLWMAVANVAPQAYLLEVAPERKGLYLSMILLLGTLGAAVGVSLSRRHVARGLRLSRVRLLLGTIAYAAPLLAVVAQLEPVWAYCGAYVVFRFASNWLFNISDNTLVDAAGAEGLGTHTSAAVGFQVVGMMMGPLAFALWSGQTAITLGVAVAVVVLTVLTVSGVAGKSEPEQENSDSELVQRRTGATLSGPGRLFVAHCVLSYMASLGMFAQLIYLVSDWLEVEGPERVGGILIAGVGLCSLATVVVSSRLEPSRCVRRSLVIAALCGLAMVGVMVTRPSVPGLVLVGVLAGVSGGRFLLLSRLIASSWTGAVGRDGMLSRYNNLGNVASILVFACFAALAGVLGESHVAYMPVMLGLFALLFIAAGVVVLFIPKAAFEGARRGTSLRSSKP